MKKGKVFGKTQIALAIMVVALGAAIWLNMEYSTVSAPNSADTSSKYLGQAEYVNAEAITEEDSVEAYFSKLKKERKQARDEAIGIIEDSLANTSLSADEREKMLLKSEGYAERTEKEAAIETILKAKGFNYSVVVIGDEDVNIVTLGEELDTSETAQIRDAIISQTDLSAGKIKIITITKTQILNLSK